MGLQTNQPAYRFLRDAICTARSEGELSRFRALALAHYTGEAREVLERLIDDRVQRLPAAPRLGARAHWAPDPAPPRAASGNG